MAIALDPDDVCVVEIPDSECQSCGNIATHTVSMDFRNAGFGENLGIFCESCADVFAEKIRDSISAKGGR